MKNKKLFIALLLCGLVLTLIPSLTHAQFFEETSSKVFSGSGQTGKGLTNPLGTTDVPTLIGNVIKAVLGVVGSIALLMFIYGGFLWMTSRGNEQSVTKGKNVITWATIGLVVIFLSYALVGFVISGITGAGGSNENSVTRGSCICTGTSTLNAPSGYTQAECNSQAPSYKPCTWTATK